MAQCEIFILKGKTNLFQYFKKESKGGSLTKKITDNS
jgi:hypothetical protein